MTAPRTFDELFTRDLPILGITYLPHEPFWRWAVIDHSRDGERYTRAATYEHCLAWIRHICEQGDAVAHESSIEYYGRLRRGLSLHVDVLGEGPVLPSRDDGTTGPSPSNVIHLPRRESA